MRKATAARLAMDLKRSARWRAITRLAGQYFAIRADVGGGHRTVVPNSSG